MRVTPLAVVVAAAPRVGGLTSLIAGEELGQRDYRSSERLPPLFLGVERSVGCQTRSWRWTDAMLDCEMVPGDQERGHEEVVIRCAEYILAGNCKERILNSVTV